MLWFIKINTHLNKLLSLGWELRRCKLKSKWREPINIIHIILRFVSLVKRRQLCVFIRLHSTTKWSKNGPNTDSWVHASTLVLSLAGNAMISSDTSQVIASTCTHMYTYLWKGIYITDCKGLSIIDSKWVSHKWFSFLLSLSNCRISPKIGISAIFSLFYRK